MISKKQSEQIFLEALCSFNYLRSYGLELAYNFSDYQTVRKNCPDLSFEEVLMHLLRRGDSIRVLDFEGDYNSQIQMRDIWDKVPTTDLRHLAAIAEGNYDADDCDTVLQTVFFGEVIFG